MSQDPKSTLKNNGTDFTPTIRHDTYDFIKPEQLNFNGRSVFITGASKGIGQAAALSFARAGASFIGLGARSDLSNLEKEVQNVAKASGGSALKILTVKLDVTDQQSVDDAAAKVKKAFGHIDVLLNNAGFLEEFVPIAESDPIRWWQSYEVNVKGVYLTTRAFLPLVLESSSKTVLNVSSIGAHLIAPGASGYQSTKLAVLRFGEFINAEYGRQGVISYGIHPGGVSTELARGMPQELHEGLIDTAELAGDSIAWLTAERREWLAGRYVAVNWDMQELLHKQDKIVSGDLLKVRLDVGMN